MITESQQKALENLIYNTLISNEEFGLGEMGECRDEAERIVNTWIEENNITVTE
jgi:hypothetical protein